MIEPKSTAEAHGRTLSRFEAAMVGDGTKPTMNSEVPITFIVLITKICWIQVPDETISQLITLKLLISWMVFRLAFISTLVVARRSRHHLLLILKRAR